MIFYQSMSGRTERTVGSIRALSLAVLAAYPAGALTLALGPDTLPTSLAGYGLVLAALIFAAMLARSSVQRIVAEEVSQLDEYELNLRYRTMSAAYTVISVLALVAVIYAAIATDNGAWVPSSFEEYNGLFWGVFLYASVLPTACLGWMLDPAELAQ